ncbi:hypothetical protein F5Y15DRAFT_292823 [Xylariaceae sp. FL0016]|nr:hypothetical protein F5Y15DRAFT_292823 [Xylariaceae sp. FL0016]
MKSRQKNTYLPYGRGIAPNELRLGSLYLDYENPNVGLEKDRFEFREKSLSEQQYWQAIKPWVGEVEVDDIPPYVLRFQARKYLALQAKFADVGGLGGESSDSAHLSIVGSKAQRYQIRKPERFLKEQVLTQPGVKKWISDRLSITWWAKLKHPLKNGKSWRTPSIWLVTGIHLISDGQVHTGWEVGRAVEVEANLDPGAAGGAPTGQKAIEFKGSSGSNVQMENLYGRRGDLVWCAQFMELAVDFTNPVGQSAPTGGHLRLFSKKEIETLGLKQIEDLGKNGVRRAVPMNRNIPSIDWKNHNANILGLRSVDLEHSKAESGDGTLATGDDPDDGKLPELSISDIPYEQDIGVQDWKIFQDHLAYLEYQD